MFEMLDADPAMLTGADLNDRLFAAHKARIQADAAECRFLADWDTRQVWAADGALSGAAWLRNRHGVASRPMRDRLRVARRLRSMPLTAAAFEAGTLAYEKVRLLANARTDATAEVFDRDERMLVASGLELDTDQFSHVMRYWRAMADAAGFSNDAKARHERRRGWLSETLDGMIKLDVVLDPETGRIVKQVLEEIMDELYRADRRDTEHQVGVAERSIQQRVADALAEMARRAAATNPNTPRRSRTEMMVLLPTDAPVDDHADSSGNSDGAPETDDVTEPAAGRVDATRRAASASLDDSTDHDDDTGHHDADAHDHTDVHDDMAGHDATVHGPGRHEEASDPAGATDQETTNHETDSWTGQDDSADPDSAHDQDDGTGHEPATGRVDAPADADASHGRGPARRDVSTRRSPAGPTGPPRADRTSPSGWPGWGGLFPASQRLPTLDNGMPIGWEIARRLACDATFRRVVINARSEILDLGRRTPNPSHAQRVAVTLRDGGCTFAGCDVPVGRCEVHHLIPYNRGSQTGGSTDLTDLTLVCSRHHHLAHEGGYTMSRNPVTGRIDTHRPDGSLIPTRPRAGLLDPFSHRQPDHDEPGEDPGNGQLPKAS